MKWFFVSFSSLKDLHEILALVSIALQVSPYYERWLQRLHACGVSKINLTCHGVDFFHAVIRFIAMVSGRVSYFQPRLL